MGLPTKFHDKLSAAIEFARQRRRGLRNVGMVAAILVFIVGLILSLRAASADLLRLQPGLLIAYAVFLPPISFLIQALEFGLTARAVGVTLTLKQSLEIVLYSSAANYLPIPGGLITRTAALRSNGVAIARSASVIILFTGIAGSVAFAYAGLWTLEGHLPIGLFGLLVALAGAITCGAIARRQRVSKTVVARAVILRAATNAFETLSFVVIFNAIGMPIQLHQAAFLVVSGFLAMLLMIFPSGLGIKEAIVAFLSPIVGIDPAAGFLAAAAARVVGMAWMVILGLVLIIRPTQTKCEAER